MLALRGGVSSTCVYGRFGQRLRQHPPSGPMEPTGPGPPWVHRGCAQLRCPWMVSGAVCGVCKSQVTNCHGCLGGCVRGVGSWCKMAVVSSSMVSFRNAAYNMFFKRTTTTLGFVLGPPTCARPGALPQACVTCKPSQEELTSGARLTGGAIVGEWALHKTFDQIWENANKGKLSHHQAWFKKE